MRRLRSRSMLRLAIPFGLLMLAVLVVPLPGSSQTTVHPIALDARQFEFTPGRIHVKQGERVVITLAASDVVHGFYLDGYGLKTRVEPGVPQRIEFIASKAGKFRYRCSVTCGPLHPFMSGELVVGSNTPFWRAIGVVGVAVTGMLVYVWQHGKANTVQEVRHGTP